MNFNVTFEIGYAIGLGKRVFLTRDGNIKRDQGLTDKIGIFDTLGFDTYSEEESLAALVRTFAADNGIPLRLPSQYKIASLRFADASIQCLDARHYLAHQKRLGLDTRILANGRSAVVGDKGDRRHFRLVSERSSPFCLQLSLTQTYTISALRL